MKRKIFALATSVCLMTTLFVGCDKKSEEAPTEAPKTELKYTMEKADYIGIEIEEKDATITDEVLQEYIDSDLMQNYTEIKEGVVEDDMIINFDYVATIDGEEYEKYDGAEMDLDGAEHAIDGYIESFIGKTIGEEYTVVLTLPSDFSDKEVAGKDVEFKITVNSHYIPSELNDEYVQRVYSYMGISTVEEYKQMYKDIIIFTNVYPIAWDKVIENIDVETYDSEEMEKEVKTAMEYLEAAAADEGLTWEEYLAENELTEEEARKQCEEEYKYEVKFMIARDYIIEQENISFTEEEFSIEVQKSMKAYGIETEEEFYTLMKQYYGVDEEYFRDNMLTTKVLEFVCDNIVVVPNLEEETTTAATK